ncbi:MAG TPA: menaquinone biosynthesis protein [Desulfomonilaceae bacterium]|nr:menaquinone biosynthesis protein [Desulfomonilaceae bacterium]
MILGNLGRMGYVNTLPVDWGVVNSPLGKLVHIIRGKPTDLNNLLATGHLDVSPVSSVAAAEHAEDWLVFDHLCIGSRGPVGSVILQADVPVERLHGMKVSITSASATASQLIRVLFAKYWHVDVYFVSDGESSPARLLIGDAALKAAHSGTGFIYDLGQVWKDFTGRNFVFGVWCVTRDFVRDHPEQTRAIYHLLLTSYAMGLAHWPEVVREAVEVTGLDEHIINDYFPKLVYPFDRSLWAGLETFLDLIGFKVDRLRTYRPQEGSLQCTPLRTASV